MIFCAEVLTSTSHERLEEIRPSVYRYLFLWNFNYYWYVLFMDYELEIHPTNIINAKVWMFVTLSLKKQWVQFRKQKHLAPVYYCKFRLCNIMCNDDKYFQLLT
ncbi:hypothetical protein PYW08_004814 [Mythimna loreyi]|uniref:Uncharacterized protein n=1 Tax=Mythimna loreyi TaxID=667449 RepID=A0ACC2QIC3_9NEOP|nr:hypothetical protein PYW08_004814 [Mythimna loreyi]